MSDLIINTDDLFSDDFDTFSKTLLPLINMEREHNGLPPLTEEQATDHFLDLINERGKESTGTA